MYICTLRTQGGGGKEPWINVTTTEVMQELCKKEKKINFIL